MSSRRVRLTYTPQGLNSSSGFRFTVVADMANDMPAEMFTLYRRPVDPNNPDTTTDDFLNVASPAELTSLPINAPTSVPGSFRSASLDVTYETQSLAEQAWSDIQAAVTTLKDNLDAQDTLGASTAVWIGTAP